MAKGINGRNDARSNLERSELFDQLWQSLEAMGHCDGYQGAEYQRVKALWIKRVRPKEIVAFILDHCNRPPTK